MSATTPRRADMASAHSPSKTNSRRVLGDIAPKALNTPVKHATTILEPSEGMRAQSPLKHVTTLSPQLFAGKENVTSGSAYQQGKKRSIYEVDGAENVEKLKPGLDARDKGALKAKSSLTAAAIHRHTEATAVDDLPPPGSPTERNTPTPEPENMLDVANSQDTHASKESFSAFVDYAACDTQPGDQPQPLPEIEEKKSRAELLRTRLGFGMYKVKTNQVAKRGSEVISTWEASSSSFASTKGSTSIAIMSPVESAASQTIPAITLSPVRHEQQPIFIKANLDPFRPIGKLTPAPVLLPTAVSSRMVHDYHMPSSPPQVVSPEQLRSPIKEPSYRTPVPKRVRSNEAVVEEEDEDKEETVEERLQRLREKRFQEGDLTSSVVKGHAAKGLLELMAGRR